MDDCYKCEHFSNLHISVVHGESHPSWVRLICQYFLALSSKTSYRLWSPGIPMPGRVVSFTFLWPYAFSKTKIFILHKGTVIFLPTPGCAWEETMPGRGSPLTPGGAVRTWPSPQHTFRHLKHWREACFLENTSSSLGTDCLRPMESRALGPFAPAEACVGFIFMAAFPGAATDLSYFLLENTEKGAPRVKSLPQRAPALGWERGRSWSWQSVLNRPKAAGTALPYGGRRTEAALRGLWMGISGWKFPELVYELAEGEKHRDICES